MLNKLTTILSGVMMGIIMVMILILLTRMNQYQFGNMTYYVILLIACVLPLCTSIFDQYDYPITTIRFIMIGVSFLIFLLYTNSIAKDESTYQTLLLIGACYHGISAITTIAISLFKNHIRS